VASAYFPLISPLTKNLSAKSELKIKEYVCQVSINRLKAVVSNPNERKIPFLVELEHSIRSLRSLSQLR